MSIVNDIHVVYVNSRLRQSGTDNDFVYDLKIHGQIDYDSITILDLSCPKSYYLVQAGFNTFTLQQGASNYTITIPPANYSRTSFRNVLQTLLNAASSFVYSVTFPSGTTTGDNGHYLFTVSNNSGVQPAFIFTTNIYELMGFNSNTTNNFVADSIESVNVINFNIESTLYLHCDSVQNNTDDILQGIIVSASPDYSFVTFQNNNIEMYSKKFIGSKSGTCRFYLTNEDGQAIYLNGNNLVFTLVIYKKRGSIDSKIENFIHLKSL